MKYKTFSNRLQAALTRFCRNGGALLVSGAFIGSDLWDSRLTAANEEDKQFAMEVLKYKWRVGQAATEGRVKCVSPLIGSPGSEYSFYHTPNSTCYVVESPDAIEPACKEATSVMRYSENGLSAAVAYSGPDYRTCVLGFPIEALTSTQQMATLIQQIMQFLHPSPEQK